jgi:phosphatidate phosphatase APP1
VQGFFPPPPIDVHGRVVNEKGEPVIATIAVKGTTLATTTDDNGYFNLKAVDENATLVISGVSIQTFEVKVNGRTALASLNAKTKIIESEEVKIISTGYQTIPKDRATGSFETVSNKALNDRISTSVTDRLEGVSSLFFDKNANRPLMVLRGYSSINANKDPLIIKSSSPRQCLQGSEMLNGFDGNR